MNDSNGNGNAIYAMMGEIRERTDALETMSDDLLRRRGLDPEAVRKETAAMTQRTDNSEYRQPQEVYIKNPPGTMIAGFGLGTTLIGLALSAFLGAQTCGFLIVAGLGMLTVGILRRIFAPRR